MFREVTGLFSHWHMAAAEVGTTSCAMGGPIALHLHPNVRSGSSPSRRGGSIRIHMDGSSSSPFPTPCLLVLASQVGAFTQVITCDSARRRADTLHCIGPAWETSDGCTDGLGHHFNFWVVIHSDSCFLIVLGQDKLLWIHLLELWKVQNEKAHEADWLDNELRHLASCLKN